MLSCIVLVAHLSKHADFEKVLSLFCQGFLKKENKNKMLKFGLICLLFGEWRGEEGRGREERGQDRTGKKDVWNKLIAVVNMMIKRLLISKEEVEQRKHEMVFLKHSAQLGSHSLQLTGRQKMLEG